MPGEVKITKLPIPYVAPVDLMVAIYARVSTHQPEQLESLNAQIDKYKKMVEMNWDWKLADIYIDIASGKSTTGRSAFNRLINDCENGKINMILTKSISRFGRNTVDILRNIYKLRKHGVDAFFEVENIKISETNKDFLISILSAVAQEESLIRSQNIKMGIDYGLLNGTSGFYTRPCYGYFRNTDNKLVIEEEQASNVRLVFSLYLQGHSVLSIIKKLQKLGIKSSSGNDTWSKRSIENMLVNEKYVGDVIVCKSFTHEFPSNKRQKNTGERHRYMIEGNHEPIIDRETFNKVQSEIEKRSNLITVNGESKRKSTHYSTKGII